MEVTGESQLFESEKTLVLSFRVLVFVLIEIQLKGKFLRPYAPGGAQAGVALKTETYMVPTISFKSDLGIYPNRVCAVCLRWHSSALTGSISSLGRLSWPVTFWKGWLISLGWFPWSLTWPEILAGALFSVEFGHIIKHELIVFRRDRDRDLVDFVLRKHGIVVRVTRILDIQIFTGWGYVSSARITFQVRDGFYQVETTASAQQGD